MTVDHRLALLVGLLVVAGSSGASTVLNPVPEETIGAGIPDWNSPADPVDAHEDRVAVLNGSAVAVHERSPEGNWHQIGTLEAPDSAGPFFGYSVAVGPTTVAVGSPTVDDDQGRVYVYTSQGGSWELTWTLAPDAEEDAFLGYDLHTDGNHLVSVAPGDETPPTIGEKIARGNAYIWDSTPGGWTLDAKVPTYGSRAFVAYDEDRLALPVREVVYEESSDSGWTKSSELPGGLVPGNPGLDDAEMDGTRLAISTQCYSCGTEEIQFLEKTESGWTVSDTHDEGLQQPHLALSGELAVSSGGEWSLQATDQTEVTTGDLNHVYHQDRHGSSRLAGSLVSPKGSVPAGFVALSEEAAIVTATDGQGAYLYDRIPIVAP